MKLKHPKAFTLVMILVILVTLSYLIPQCFSDSYSLFYQLLDSPNGSVYYNLNVVVPQSLYEYYQGKDHKQVSVEDFAKFVTPYALKPIADQLLEIYKDYEDFANGVLMIVHQIPYDASGPAKYPAETLVENKGDCDQLSYIAASIMKAGGLDVVLLYYEDKAHMNMGVHLSHTPLDARTPPYYVTYNGVRYYIAESTGGSWEDGWRVGECPPDLKREKIQIITLENSEQWAPGQVSASYETLTPSTLTLTASSTFVYQGNTVTLFGQLSPNLQNEIITIYFKRGSSPWAMLATATTDSNGRFTSTLNVNETGLYYVRASWSGNDHYMAADSSVISITSLSALFLVSLAIVIALICTGAVVFILKRQKYPEVEEHLIPEVPSLLK